MTTAGVPSCSPITVARALARKMVERPHSPGCYAALSRAANETMRYCDRFRSGTYATTTTGEAAGEREHVLH